MVAAQDISIARQCCVELVARRRIVWRVGPHHGAQPVDAGFIDLCGGKPCRQRLQQQPGIEQIADRGAQVLQIDDDGVRGRGGVGLADSRPPFGPRRMRATWWCSTSRTASRSTDRLTR